ncbi:putative membrane protein [Pseudoduganella lurida]|uniref:Putative membrane protein n=1 Tax=Pseudoduganella lurida TaxID=1036180 RepID=A0A562RM59_9BURK|nr:TMEM175 family protein [Pseudoduganella lurida]TWI69540.1 putative membrane protein [Pseudoduganella lurida]
MGKGRLEAFSDGVIAIIITIMVLELKVPHHPDFNALLPLWPVFMSYVLSFIYVGIYWNNHHHLLHAVQEVSGGVLWANLHLLFWLSLIPFVTAWMGENHFETGPTAAYGFVLAMCAVAFWLLTLMLVSNHPKNATLAEATGENRKGKISIVLYLAGVALSFFAAWMGFLAYAVVAALWLIPDRRIEAKVVEEEEKAAQEEEKAAVKAGE